MVKYTYDAWGNHSVEVVDADCATLANLNPFRYRSYYYDDETSLYYLNTRYYDPVIGRFMTIDSIAYLAPDIINGLNLYAYCNNNPVMCVDPNGTDAILITVYGRDGVPIVGHSALLFEANGKWYITEFGAQTKAAAKVVLTEAKMKAGYEAFLNDYFNSQPAKGVFLKFRGYETVYLKGDYSQCYDIAKFYQGSNYGGYNLFSNNCLDYVQELLAVTKGVDRNLSVQAYHNSSITMVPSLYSTGTKAAATISDGMQVVKKVVSTVGQSIKDFVSNTYNTISSWWR